MTLTAIQLRNEALLMLQGEGAILDVARRVSKVLAAEPPIGAVIGGVAVMLHGHVRTTADVDVFVPGALPEVAAKLESIDCRFDAGRREFKLDGVPVHLVTPDQAAPPPTHYQTIDGVLTISLADLLNLKLQSGTRNMLRAQDLADVIGLIRHHRLDGRFGSRIVPPLRAEFRKLVAAVRKEESTKP